MTTALNLDLSVLNPPQREAVIHGLGPLLILAGAGSGKTRVITYRIAYLLECGAKPWDILAVTFTNKAASEMKKRVFELTGARGSGVWISTFHSFCAGFLRREGSYFGLDTRFAILDQEDQKKVVKDVLQELVLDEKKYKLGALVSRISREKDQLIDSESFRISASASNDPSKELLSTIYSLYQKKLDKMTALDFGDLILKTVELLQNHPPLREKYQERFHHVLVDEYQDTNRAQYVLTKLLASKHRNICVVGDDDQSIYSWRGADIRNILDFEKDYDHVKVIKLEENYRSTEPILSAAWKVVQNNEMRKEKKLWTERQSSVPVCARQFHDELGEAEWIAREIGSISREKNIPLSHFALFYRTNAQSRVLEGALRSQDLPYLLIGNVRFYERAEVKDVLAYLKVIAVPQDDLSLKRILNFPPRGIGKSSLDMIEQYSAKHSLSLYRALSNENLRALLPPRARESIESFRKMLEKWMGETEKVPVGEILGNVLRETKILELMKEESRTDLEAAGRLDNVQELMNAVEEFEQRSEEKTLSAYLQQVSLLTDIDAWDEEKNGVTLMTVHLAKGLEFPVVYLTGLEEGLFPLGEAQYHQQDLEEERRLAYVGMTRAKDRLFLTCAASRRLFGQTHWNMPSRFILESGVKLQELEEQAFHDSVSPRQDSFSAKASFPTKSRAFRIGEWVIHDQFGRGKITEKSGEGENLKVRVVFESGTWKNLLVKYANLRRANGNH